jgi:hypothetical protein
MLRSIRIAHASATARRLINCPPPHHPAPQRNCLCPLASSVIMGVNEQNSGGPTTGGFHFPDVTQLFRHHPTRPTPRAGPPADTPVPVGTLSGYAKYFAGGAICCTVTHVSTFPQLSMLSEGHDNADRCCQDSYSS